MISCELFRSRFTSGTNDAEVLEHLRACDHCLAFAAEGDPDVMFRALGGGDLVPPGGVDAFVGDVMREVHLRSTEKRMVSSRRFGWKRLAAAAAVAATLVGTLLYQRAPVQTVAPPQQWHARAASIPTKPVIESYDSESATIVEVPTEGAEDVKVVMIFDEKLPADL